MNDRGQYGFGHLRFQEYLAARELNLNRTRKLEYVVGRPSWTGVFEQLIQLVDSPREFLQDSAMSMLSPESLNELLKSLPEEVRRMGAP